MNRREFLQCAAILVSGVSASQIGLSMSPAQQRFIAARPNYIAASVNYFTEEQRRAVAAISEIIIPVTDTPGAIDAGVPRFIELMVSDWFNEGERNIFDEGLQALMRNSKQRYGASFDALPPGRKLRLLAKLESEAGDADWYQFGNTLRTFDSQAPFICQMKELTIWGFFTSEVGATQVLRYDPMPMKFDGNRKLGPDESSWKSSSF